MSHMHIAYLDSEFLDPTCCHEFDQMPIEVAGCNGFIMQFGFIPYSSAAGNLDGSTTGEKVFNLTFPVPFTLDCFSLQTTLCIAELEVGNDTWLQVYGVSNTGATLLNQTANAQSGSQQPFLGIYWQAIGR